MFHRPRPPFVLGYIEAIVTDLGATPSPESFAQIDRDCATILKRLDADDRHDTGAGWRFWQERQAGNLPEPPLSAVVDGGFLYLSTPPA
jgi:hypothetical protein